MQCEYDRWFYHGNTLDQLPSVTRDRMGDPHPSAGPKLVLNTTSLLTGERVAFSREPLSSLKEVKGVNKNILALSRIVGASSGVPVLFPPTPVLGDLLVDGGVSDNQGIEALLEEKCNILLVSDASGQMEPVHSLSSKESSVFGRVNEILQFQVRTKLLDRLVAWKQQEENRWFAFVHLFLNLKDRAPEVPRVPSEYIPGIARTRTDLDQFSFVEREALMYHGYTLIDAQLQKYCGPVVERIPRAETGLPPMRTAPLFSKAAAGEADLKVEERRRSRIQKELALAATKMLLVRSLQKYPGKTAQAFLVGAAPMLALSASLFLRFKDSVLPSLASALGNWLAGAIPAPALSFLDSFLEGGNLPTVTTIAGAVGLLLGYIILLALPLYVSSFTWYLATRSASVKADRQTYRQLSAGKDPSPSWPSDAEERS